jgi:hypothetical protein
MRRQHAHHQTAHPLVLPDELPSPPSRTRHAGEPLELWSDAQLEVSPRSRLATSPPLDIPMPKYRVTANDTEPLPLDLFPTGAIQPGTAHRRAPQTRLIQVRPSAGDPLVFPILTTSGQPWADDGTLPLDLWTNGPT